MFEAITSTHMDLRLTLCPNEEGTAKTSSNVSPAVLCIRCSSFETPGTELPGRSRLFLFLGGSLRGFTSFTTGAFLSGFEGLPGRAIYQTNGKFSVRSIIQ